MERLRANALAAVKPGDEQSQALHAWLALAWALEVQQAEIAKLIDRVREVEPDALISA